MDDTGEKRSGVIEAVLRGECAGAAEGDLIAAVLCAQDVQEGVAVLRAVGSGREAARVAAVVLRRFDFAEVCDALVGEGLEPREAVQRLVRDELGRGVLEAFMEVYAGRDTVPVVVRAWWHVLAALEEGAMRTERIDLVRGAWALGGSEIVRGRLAELERLADADD